MQILNGKIVTSDLTKNAMGGSELMAYRLQQSIPQDLLSKFQIVLSRLTELDYNKYRILWCHDLAADPAANHLAQGGWAKFNKIVFVSYWQRQQFMDLYGIPPSKTIVLQNAIYPLNKSVAGDTIRFIYHTTPHRGLEILVPVFNKLSEQFKNIHLDVYSSFSVYGWEDRDNPYKELFNYIDEHPQMTYHGGQSNDTIRKALLVSDIFAYPCIHLETSCIALIEAMSAGLICVHPNIAALPETSANCTIMYNYHEDFNIHANVFYKYLYDLLFDNNSFKVCKKKANMASDYANIFYDWNSRKISWKNFLESMLHEPMNPSNG